jgi:hypothetical protein
LLTADVGNCVSVILKGGTWYDVAVSSELTTIKWDEGVEGEIWREYSAEAIKVLLHAACRREASFAKEPTRNPIIMEEGVSNLNNEWSIVEERKFR